MKIKWTVFILLGIFFLLNPGCDEKDNEPEVNPPTNLQVRVTQDQDNPGNVTVFATADNANFYRFYFEDRAVMVEEESGEAEYNYSNSGEHIIIVQAHTTPEVFITEEVVVTVELNGVVGSEEGYSTPLSYEGYSLVWQDEFEGEELSGDWTFETGTGNNGWGNNELQYYRRQNTHLEKGYLVITAQEEDFGGKRYTSSRIITESNKEFQYGRIDIRAKLPKGKGIWPALWMLGSNFSTVGWPECGEIDIMEMVGGQADGGDNTIHGTVHWDNSGNYASYGGSYTLNSGIFNDEFHVFSIEWDSNTITWYIDDMEYHVIDISPVGLSEFRQEFFFIFNMAVGGNWPGSPDFSTKFPQYFIIDYVRVFQPDEN